MSKSLVSALRHWPAAMVSLALAAMTAAAGAAPADGVTRTTLLIGQSITLQGGKNAYGTAVQDGIDTYLKVANGQGGVHGRKILLKTLDDDNGGSKAESNARDLVQKEKAFILFGSIEGGPSTAVMKSPPTGTRKLSTRTCCVGPRKPAALAGVPRPSRTISNPVVGNRSASAKSPCIK